MGQSFEYTEPTIWALRKNTRRVKETTSSLYEHLLGYEPIETDHEIEEDEEAIRKGSAENPQLNILNPETNFIVMELSSEDTTER
jgi:hypothetical protein